DPHPDVELIKQWAATGQPVYEYDEHNRKWKVEDNPRWLRGLKHSLNPPKEPQHIEVRDYLYKNIKGEYAKGTANKAFDDCALIETHKRFVKWLDDDWWLIEV